MVKKPAIEKMIRKLNPGVKRAVSLSPSRERRASARRRQRSVSPSRDGALVGLGRCTQD